MTTLPVDATLKVYTTNCKYPLIFTVGYDRVERFRYWSSGERFKSLRSVHRYCSAQGNILYIEMEERASIVQGNLYGEVRYSRPITFLTSGQFQRAKLPKRFN